MKNELKFRPLKKEDYETICKWWKWWWKGKVMEKDILPDDGKGGFVIEKNDQPIVCGFLYLTNSKTSFLGWIVSNPEYKQKDRKEIIKLLIHNMEEFSRELGYEYIITVCSNKHLIDMHKDLDWTVNKQPSYEIIKKL